MRMPMIAFVVALVLPGSARRLAGPLTTKSGIATRQRVNAEVIQQGSSTARAARGPGATRRSRSEPS
jgi:hypothetical protein